MFPDTAAQSVHNGSLQDLRTEGTGSEDGLCVIGGNENGLAEILSHLVGIDIESHHEFDIIQSILRYLG